MKFLALQWLRFRMALSFFTRLPTGDVSNGNDEDFGRSFIYLPFVGLTIGIVISLLTPLLQFLFPPAVFVPLLLAMQIYITGGIHMDGFMDTFDGVFSARKPERVLEIMRDSRVGAHAVLSVIVLLLTKAGALYSLYQPAASLQGATLETVLHWITLWRWESGFYNSNGVNPLYLSLFWIPMVGRWAIAYGAGRFPYARQQGMATLFNKYIDEKVLRVAEWVTLIVALIMAGVYGLFMMVLVRLFVDRWGKKMTRFLGGLTGDIYGATCEMVEVLCLLLLVFLQKG
ncbi:adenosylcobinamide-GDP ribazoletransferase [Heliobacterium chlorum]|uniref:Adenosylcobinamide-GDP ribazoletransferase n=1 Tax=Heliobacterium chlorum TaxID=2698 RepID=A0ABR7T549_HELCL|nr:adenosylcobinamide-GDP ribazoletransferase [Heliobacterium chlorum]